MWVIILAGGVILVAAVILFLKKAFEQERSYLEARKARDEREALALEQFRTEHGFVAAVDVRWGNHKAWLALRDAEIELLAYRQGEPVEIMRERRIPLTDLIGLHLRTEDKEEHFTRTITTPLVVMKKKNAVARGLVGGMAAGPAGMVLGAASALSPTTKIVEHYNEVKDKRTVAGPPTLVFGLRDHAEPMQPIEFRDAALAEAWVARIKERATAA